MSIEYGGFDIRFTTPSLSDGSFIDLKANVDITNGAVGEDTIFRISRSGLEYYIIVKTADTLYETFVTEVVPKYVRWFIHNNFASVYINEQWIHTFYFTNVDYPEYEDMVLSLTANGETLTLENVTVSELFDWREAIYIDFDSVASNAISSVIQQRPIEVNPKYTGVVNFQYSADEKRDVLDINQKLIVRAEKKRDAKNVLSDAIVYGSQVEVLTSESTASHHGFITRIIRVPELDTGARRAAKVMIKKAEQQAIQYIISMRADTRIEMGDVVQCTYVLSGTQKTVDISCIVESVNIVLKNAEFSLTVTGRNYEE